jgi:hypothetical protein
LTTTSAWSAINTYDYGFLTSYFGLLSGLDPTIEPHGVSDKLVLAKSLRINEMRINKKVIQHLTDAWNATLNEALRFPNMLVEVANDYDESSNDTADTDEILVSDLVWIKHAQNYEAIWLRKSSIRAQKYTERGFKLTGPNPPSDWDPSLSPDDW